MTELRHGKARSDENGKIHLASLETATLEHGAAVEKGRRHGGRESMGLMSLATVPADLGREAKAEVQA